MLPVAHIDDRSINTKINEIKHKKLVLEDRQNQNRLEIAGCDRQIYHLEALRKSLLDKARTIEVKVTDHAILRYLERHCKIDIEHFRLQIKQEIEEEVIKAYGSGEVLFASGRMIVDEFVVKTFVTENNQES